MATTEVSSFATGTHLYRKLSKDQQGEFSARIVNKLKKLIGGHQELSVLAEYIAVMLQSARPPSQIEAELENFLREHSGAFTRWLCDSLAQVTDEAGVLDSGGEQDDLAGEKPQKKRRSAGAEPGAPSAPPRKLERNREKPAGTSGKASKKGGARNTARSRSRRRRRDAARDVAAGAAQEDLIDVESGEEQEAVAAPPPGEEPLLGYGELAGGEPRVILTPNVRFLRDSYHSKGPEDEPEPEDGPPPGDIEGVGAALTARHEKRRKKKRDRAEAQSEAPAPQPAVEDGRWSFRAGAVPGGGPSPRPWPGASGPPGWGAHYAPPGVVMAMPLEHHGGPPGHGGPPRGPRGGDHARGSRPGRHFAPKKWRVARAGTVVRSTEELQSSKVQTLNEGEIVEQTAPHYTLRNGIIRVQIRHPSSPQFPNPIGWVTLDATCVGGPKLLEPGPEPMQKPRGSGGGGYHGPPGGHSHSSWSPRGPPPAAAAAAAAARAHAEAAAASTAAAPAAATPAGAGGAAPGGGGGGGASGPPGVWSTAPRTFQNLVWRPTAATAAATETAG